MVHQVEREENRVRAGLAVPLFRASLELILSFDAELGERVYLSQESRRAVDKRVPEQVSSLRNDVQLDSFLQAPAKLAALSRCVITAEPD